MLKKEDFMVIKALANRGVYQKDIAAELGVHPKTVSRVLKRGATPAPKRMRCPQESGPVAMVESSPGGQREDQSVLSRADRHDPGTGRAAGGVDQRHLPGARHQ